MKTFLLFILVFSFINTTSAQITTPVIKANFGVDGDLKANYFNNGSLPGNDDWLNLTVLDR